MHGFDSSDYDWIFSFSSICSVVAVIPLTRGLPFIMIILISHLFQTNPIIVSSVLIHHYFYNSFIYPTLHFLFYPDYILLLTALFTLCISMCAIFRLTIIMIIPAAIISTDFKSNDI